jgi:hypothetical protein
VPSIRPDETRAPPPNPEAEADGIADTDEDDREGRGGLLGSTGRLGTGCHDQADVGSEEFGRKGRKPVELPCVPPVLDLEIAPFDIAKGAQALAECFPFWTVGGTENPDPPDLSRRLRLGGERRGEEAASQGAEERSPVHHSIT